MTYLLTKLNNNNDKIKKQKNTSSLNPLYTIRSLELMNWLCHKGYTVIKVIDSDKDPKFKVFLFEDSLEIRRAVTDYIVEQRIRKAV